MEKNNEIEESSKVTIARTKRQNKSALKKDLYGLKQAGQSWYI